MRAIILASIAFAALAACGQTQTKAPPAPPTAPVAFDVHIEVGRYGAMLSTVSDLTSEQAGAPPADEAIDERAMARDLREHVWELNLLRSKLCARGIQTQLSCAPAFNPVWLADPADAEVSLTEIQARNEALGNDVMPLWDAVCEEARSHVPEEEKMSVCPME